MSAILHIFQRGFSLRKNRRQLPDERKGGGKRGCLDGSFSSASFRRLREFVVRFSVLEAECWGITLTVPGIELISIQDFKKLHHRLVVFCNDNSIPMVWRVELQQRKMPHLHCVVYGTVGASMSVLFKWFKLLKRFQCLEAVDGDFIYVSRAFLKGSSHAVDLQRLSGGFSAFRYLVNHMSKAKQVQLGWAGRNWGVCNKSLFSVDEGVKFEVYDFEYFYIVRWLKRLTRRHVFRQGCSFWVTNPELIRRMHDYIVECERISGGVENDVRNSGARRVHWEWTYFCLSFLTSIPQAYFDSVFDSIKKDCHKVKFDLVFMVLRWLVVYMSFCGASRSNENLNVLNPTRASRSNENLNVLNPTRASRSNENLNV